METEMQALNSAQPQADRFKAFWDRMAGHYPLPFDKKVLADTERVIALTTHVEEGLIVWRPQ